MDNLKIAIQRKGRLAGPSERFLRSKGLEFNQDSNRLTVVCQNFPATVVKVRDDDIPKYVSESLVDFGIVGLNVLEESGFKARVLKRLGFCKCSLKIAAPKNSGISKISDLERKRIATSYPKILRGFLSVNNIKAEIVTVSGSVEVAPYLQAADAVCDLVETGSTLKQFNLIPIATVMKSEAVLIEGLNSKNRFLDKLSQRL
jgi:ATP phosphoribosyltransferase